jgi:hypothetical protein
VSVDQKITNAVKLALGEQVFQIIALQTQCQDLAERLDAEKAKTFASKTAAAGGEV